MSPLLVALGVAILAYILFILIIPNAVPKESDDYLRQALDRLAEENKSAEQSREQLLRDQLGDAPPLVRALFAPALMRPIFEAGLQAGLQHKMQKLLSVMLLAFGATSALFFLIGGGALSLLGGLLVAYLAPLHYCKRSIHKRNAQFVDQFPDALDTIVRSVRSGFPLSVALQMLAENTQEPVRSEFRQVADEISLGRTLAHALSRLATRINEPDIRFFVVVLTVQQETGGNLAEIINNLSGIIRKRKQIRHKIRALTSEGKATGIILGGLPIFVFIALYFLQPSYLAPFFNDPLGHQLLGGTIALIVTCFFIIKQMINVDI